MRFASYDSLVRYEVFTVVGMNIAMSGICCQVVW